jgi:MacB-like periplasmic core domain
MSLTRVAMVTVGGGVLGVGLAIAASPLMPIGPARLAEPSPGVEVNLAVLGAGLAVTAVLPVLLVLPAAWRAARAASGPLGVAEPASPQHVSRLGLVLAQAGSVTGGLGTRMALEPGHGRTAVPVRSALAGTIVAVAAVVAATVFGTSLLGLVTTPHRYGQNWTQKVDFMLPSAPAPLLAQVMTGQPGVRGYAPGSYGQITVNRQDVSAIGLDPVRGHGFLTILAGRLPAGRNEIALGEHTLHALHTTLGQTVRVSANGRTARLRVVGETVLPAFTEGGAAATDLGDGAVVPPSLLSMPHQQTGCGPGVTCYSFLLIRYRPDIPLRAADGHLEATIRRLSHGQCLLSQGCYTLTADQRPADIRNYAGARDTPLLLGALLGVLAIGTLSTRCWPASAAATVTWPCSRLWAWSGPSYCAWCAGRRPRWPHWRCWPVCRSACWPGGGRGRCSPPPPGWPAGPIFRPPWYCWPSRPRCCWPTSSPPGRAGPRPGCPPPPCCGASDEHPPADSARSAAFATVALLIGLPLGLLAGRWAWVLFADAAGVSSAATVPVALLLAIIPVTLALALLIAAWPARAAARVRPAVALRTEQSNRTDRLTSPVIIATREANGMATLVGDVTPQSQGRTPTSTWTVSTSTTVH